MINYLKVGMVGSFEGKDFEVLLLRKLASRLPDANSHTVSILRGSAF